MAGDAADLVCVHGRLAQACGVQALPERGRELDDADVGGEAQYRVSWLGVTGQALGADETADRRYPERAADRGAVLIGQQLADRGDAAALDVHPSTRLRDEGATCSSSQACQCTPVI